MRFSVLKRQAAAVLVSFVLTAPVLAQDMFAPKLYVNDRAITVYEVEQRALFLQVLRAPGNPEDEAMKALLEDRLHQTEAERLGIKLSEQDLTAGLTEFAARANLTAEQFTAELAKAGVAAETFRDFVAAGLLWRQVVRARFLGQVPISEADIDKALEASARPRALQVLVSELVIPAPQGEEQAALAKAQELSDSISGESAFASAARRFSAAPTAGAGGRLDWLPLANLPPAIGQKILALDAGEVSDPIAVRVPREVPADRLVLREHAQQRLGIVRVDPKIVIAAFSARRIPRVMVSENKHGIARFTSEIIEPIQQQNMSDCVSQT